MNIFVSHTTDIQFEAELAGLGVGGHKLVRKVRLHAKLLRACRICPTAISSIPRTCEQLLVDETTVDGKDGLRKHDARRP